MAYDKIASDTHSECAIPDCQIKPSTKKTRYKTHKSTISRKLIQARETPFVHSTHSSYGTCHTPEDAINQQYEPTKKTDHKKPPKKQDLIWHTHLAFPLQYAADCQQLVQLFIKHDESVNDREEGSKLIVCTKRTIELWDQEYKKEPWRKRGAMYRGACM
jgi:hypothetical protein